MNDDERLKEAFSVLRRADARRVPSFEAMARPPAVRRPSPVRFVVPVGSALAVAAAALVWLGVEQGRPTPLLSRAASAPAVLAAPPDLAPLDFLLRTPALAALSEGFDDYPLPGSSR